MIPVNINKNHIIRSIKTLDNDGIPEIRKSSKYLIHYQNKYYPPKLVVSISNKFINGKELNPSSFSGGKETNNFLIKLGFKIVKKENRKKLNAILSPNKKNVKHLESCKECKLKIYNFLNKIYHQINVNYKLSIPTDVEEYKNYFFYKDLKKIYNSLITYRGHSKFVFKKSLPHCDIFIKQENKLIELDESQHFTKARLITLKLYPDYLEVGFDRNKWINRCIKINAVDNNPPYRDEQRAWYDTLRDFAPLIMSMKPTKRILMKDSIWCNLNTKNKKDVNYIKELTQDKYPIIKTYKNSKVNMNIIIQSNPSIARIIMTKFENGNISFFHKVCDYWPKGYHVDYLMTCGGFFTFKLPDNIKHLDNPKEPESKLIKLLENTAENHIHKIFNKSILIKLKKITNYISIGIDLTRNNDHDYHIELIAMYDLSNNKIHFTGKFYPTSQQENWLIRHTDLQSHFIKTKNDNVLILGCHDLNVFNPRARKNAGSWRKNIIDSFLIKVHEFKPNIILQHPHTADSDKTWLGAWRTLEKEIPYIKSFAGSGKYCYSNGKSRSPLEKVLSGTASNNVMSFIFL